LCQNIFRPCSHNSAGQYVEENGDYEREIEKKGKEKRGKEVILYMATDSGFREDRYRFIIEANSIAGMGLE
jgi:hypothetical protein